MEIGKIIKKLRMKRGLSQSDLAEKINEEFKTSLNKGMVSKWENGVGDPRIDTVRYLALFFNVSLDYLLGIEKYEEDHLTIAAHHDGEEWTDEELDEIERFKEFVKSRRKNKE
ncbi:helix-turn-helix domain-containing protein [Niallia taxi]|uniref:helix-turn-helix domain-containing protein n=1 Tax=Niallia taxi TaxID=2499688 RepID=UPI003F6307EF